MDSGQPHAENLCNVEITHQFFEATIELNNMNSVAPLLDMRENLAHGSSGPHLAIHSV